MDRCVKEGLIQKIPPTRESFEETVTVDFVRLTTGGSCSNAKDILHCFGKTTGGDWCIKLEVTPYDYYDGLFAGVREDDEVVFEG